jgi:diguanylate cyclase (GGDEF)-like protein
MRAKVRGSAHSPDWFHSRATRDIFVIISLGLTCFAATVYFDLFDKFAEFAWKHEAWKLDEIAAAIFLVGLGALLFSFRRVVDLRRAREEAYSLARHDELTGLPNRRQFLEQLSDWKSRLRQNEKCAVFLIDLDDFKPINDLYGHRLGDEVLRTTATRLKKIVGDRALVARIGGDEFGILLPVASDEEAPLRVARCIVKEVPKPIKLAALSLNVGVSVGIAMCTAEDDQSDVLTAQDGSATETVIRQADMAHYQAKKEEGSGYHFFRQEMDEQLRLRVELEREIGPAIKAGQIVPYYQPFVDLRTGAVVGCETLARWEHPSRGLLQPSIFIPVAETTGNISELTYALLRQALQDAQTWPGELSVSLNLSPRMIANSWLPQEVLRILTECSFPAHRLELEITETTLIDRAKEARTVLKSLRHLGVRIALDDFGAGYSGLSYLRNFEFDRIKVDRSFVREILANPRDLRLVENIISFCHTLGLQTTAEGIESFELGKRLMELGCDTGQGYFFCKPKPNSKIVRYLNGALTGLLRKAG